MSCLGMLISFWHAYDTHDCIQRCKVEIRVDGIACWWQYEKLEEGAGGTIECWVWKSHVLNKADGCQEDRSRAIENLVCIEMPAHNQGECTYMHFSCLNVSHAYT